jgi:hypothetical protein
MQDNKKDISNGSDMFVDALKQKLENHQLQVDEDVWAGIAARMDGGKRKRLIPFWWWFSGGAAVAVLILLFTFIPVHDSTDVAIGNHNKVGKNVAVRAEIAAQNPLVIYHKVIHKQAEYNRVQQQTTHIRTDNAENKSAHLENKPNAELSATDGTIERSAFKDSRKIDAVDLEAETPSAATRDSSATNHPKKQVINSLVAKNEDYTLPEKQTGNKWLLAAAVGAGGEATLSGSSNLVSADLGNKNIVSAQTNYTNILNPNDFSEKNFMAPLSLGLMVRKDLNKSVGLESGLVYSYLLSTFRLSNYMDYDASLKLYYLGIPVNFIVRLWKIHNVEVYTSAGIMVEKGLQSVYVQHQNSGYQEITTIVKSDISGWQWSINTGIGVTYKIQRNIGIYFEPKFSYFPDNNQPISVRTEHPVVVGLMAGVRYQFK